MGLKEFKQGSVVAANKKISFMGVFIPVNVALGATQPLLPLLVLQVGGNVADVGLISSAYSLLSVFSSRFWGSVSDRVGKRKPFIVLGFASTGFILTLFSFASKVWQLILLNALMGFLTTAYIPSASMLIIEGSSKKEWTSRLSVYNLFNGVGWSLGLAVGALWLTFGSLKTLLWVLALFSIAGAVMSTHVIKEPFITIERYAITSFALEIVDHIRYIPTLMFNLPRLFNPFRWSKMIKLALVRDLPLFYSSTIVFFTAFSIFFTPIPTYLKSLGILSSTIFLLFLIHNFTATSTFIIVNKLSLKVSEKSLIELGIFVRLMAFFAFSMASVTGFFIGNEWSIATIMIFTGISWAFFWAPSSSLLSKIADQSRLGEAQGNLNAIVGVGSILGSLISGYLVITLGYQLNFLLSALMMVIGFVLFINYIY